MLHLSPVTENIFTGHKLSSFDNKVSVSFYAKQLLDGDGLFMSAETCIGSLKVGESQADIH